MRRRIQKLALALALALTLGGPATPGLLAAPEPPIPVLAGGPQVPRLQIEAPPALWGEAAALHAVHPARWGPIQGLVGAHDPGAPIRVLLVAEDDPIAHRTPRSISGFAVPEEDLVVLLPRRVPSYPYGSLDELLVHEVTHVLLARAAGGRPLPRWFHEGVALVAAHGWNLADRGRLLLGGIGGAPTSAEALDRAFGGEQHEVDTAYVLAGAMVQELLRSRGRGTVAAITAGVAAGRPFEEAFATAAGTTLPEFETAFWRRFRLLYRWVPFLTSGATLWIAITLLAVVAAGRRRARDAAIRRRWDDEEAAAGWAAAPAGAAEGPLEAAGEDLTADDAHESRYGPH